MYATVCGNKKITNPFFGDETRTSFKHIDFSPLDIAMQNMNKCNISFLSKVIDADCWNYMFIIIPINKYCLIHVCCSDHCLNKVALHSIKSEILFANFNVFRVRFYKKILCPQDFFLKPHGVKAPITTEFDHNGI